MREFDIVLKYFLPLAKKNKGAVNLSDDIFIDFKNKIGISIDTYIENKHFLYSKRPQYYIKKIFRSALSDLYCKGLTPTKYFVSLSLKKNQFNKKNFLHLKKILLSEQKKFDVLLSGGDLTVSKIMSLTLVVMGIFKERPILRSGANYLDDIYVTGNIGDSYIGLKLFQKKIFAYTKNNYFKKMYTEPDLPYKFSKFLFKFANSSIDISDGIFQDLKHLLSSSKKGALIHLEKIPLSKPFLANVKSKNIDIKNMISNGDDYQIIFTSKKNNRSIIQKYSKIANVKVTRIGSITKSRKLKIKNYGKIIDFDVKRMGYTHIF